MKTTDEGRDAPLHERVTARAADLTARERQVAEYMAQHPDEVAVSSATGLARATGTSDATVIRTAQALGYPGLRELKRAVIETLTRRRNPASVLDDRLGRIGQGNQGFDLVLSDTIDLAHQLRAGISDDVWRDAVSTVLGARRVYSFGIGPAGCLADHLAIMLNRIGLESHSLSTTGFRLADGLLALAEDDAVVVFAPLRLFREVDLVVEHARKVRARVIVITEALGLSLENRVDVVLATPQTTSSASSELTAGLLLGHALVLAVASSTRDRSLETMELLNRLRADAAGVDLDVRPLPSI